MTFDSERPQYRRQQQPPCQSVSGTGTAMPCILELLLCGRPDQALSEYRLWKWPIHESLFNDPINAGMSSHDIWCCCCYIRDISCKDIPAFVGSLKRLSWIATSRGDTLKELGLALPHNGTSCMYIYMALRCRSVRCAQLHNFRGCERQLERSTLSHFNSLIKPVLCRDQLIRL